MLPTESNKPLFKSTFFANPEPHDALVTLETTFLLALARLPARRLNAVAPSMLIHAASHCLTKSGDCAAHGLAFCAGSPKCRARILLSRAEISIPLRLAAARNV